MKIYSGWVLTSALFGVCAVGAAGCRGVNCTDADCDDTVTISATAESWLAGDYAVGVTTPERAFTCSMSIPRDSEGAAGQAGSSVADAKCTQTAGTAAKPWEFPSIYFADGVSIHWPWAPSEMDLTLHYQGQELLKERLAPTYEKVHPNGPDCAPTCLNSRVTLEALSPTAT